MKERLQKILSAHGIASRRGAEELISRGEVSVNGIVASLGDKADTDTDKICVNGTLLPSNAEKLYIAVNKPAGYLTTVSDDRGRKTVIDLIPDITTRVYPVGRLDMDSSGLLFLTNDGDFANRVMHPSLEKEKRYRVEVEGDVHKALPVLNSPMIIDNYEIRPAEVSLCYSEQNDNVLIFTIHEGRNRQIRKMCAQTDLVVKNLHRISIGTVNLDNLRPGKWRYLSEEEVNSFK